MKLKKILSLVLAGVMALSVTGCVNQHPEETGSTNSANESGEVRLVATSPAVAQICNRLGLDLVGICESSSDLPERYDGVTTVGMAMNPDLEIISSLDPTDVLMTGGGSAGKTTSSMIPGQDSKLLRMIRSRSLRTSLWRCRRIRSSGSWERAAPENPRC